MAFLCIRDFYYIALVKCFAVIYQNETLSFYASIAAKTSKFEIEKIGAKCYHISKWDARPHVLRLQRGGSKPEFVSS